MRSTPTWDGLVAIANRVATIRTPEYRSDIGQRVLLEPAELELSDLPAAFVTAGNITYGERRGKVLNSIAMEFAVEAHIPVEVFEEEGSGSAQTEALTAAQRLAHEAMADIADALPDGDFLPGEPARTCTIRVSDRRIVVAPAGAAVVVVVVTGTYNLVETRTSA
jgi:hypothetical protein